MKTIVDAIDQVVVFSDLLSDLEAEMSGLVEAELFQTLMSGLVKRLKSLDSALEAVNKVALPGKNGETERSSHLKSSVSTSTELTTLLEPIEKPSGGPIRMRIKKPVPNKKRARKKRKASLQVSIPELRADRKAKMPISKMAKKHKCSISHLYTLFKELDI